MSEEKIVKLPSWWWKIKREYGNSLHPTLDHIQAVKKFNDEYCAEIIEVHSRPYTILESQFLRLIFLFQREKIHFKISGETTYDNHDTILLRMWQEPTMDELIGLLSKNTREEQKQ